MKQAEYVLNNDREVLAFLKNHYPLYHLSNIFFRDVQYGIQKMFEKRGDKLKYPEAEKIAKQFVEKLEKEKVFNRIDQQSWVLNYPEFRKPVVMPVAPAKPATGSAPAKSPAAGGARPALPPLSGAKPAGGTPAAAKPALPPLSSAKPALPPLTSAKPASGAKPALPPLANARPVGAKPVAPAEATLNTNPTEAKVVEQAGAAVEVQAKREPTPAEDAHPSAPVAGVSPAAASPGQRKPLPPLRGNYTPAGKK